MFQYRNKEKNPCKFSSYLQIFPLSKHISYLCLCIFRMATEAKRPKLDIEDLKTLNDFQVKKVLNEFPDSKKIFLEGRMAGDKAENPAILTLEKTPFNPLKIDEILKNSQLKLEFKNDIYGQYECQIIDPSLNGIKTNLIYPATQRHIEKCISSNHFIIEETPALYKTVTLPCISR